MGDGWWAGVCVCVYHCTYAFALWSYSILSYNRLRVPIVVWNQIKPQQPLSERVSDPNIYINHSKDPPACLPSCLPVYELKLERKKSEGTFALICCCWQISALQCVRGITRSSVVACRHQSPPTKRIMLLLLLLPY